MFFHASRGVIALDIDGTITAKTDGMHPDIIHYFHSLQEQGWTFIFLTGRTFGRAYRTLQALPFPYFLSVQNGATTIELPSREIVDQKYLVYDLLPMMDRLCQEEKTDYIVYMGFNHRDVCYYRPSYLSSDLLAYLQRRSVAVQEDWQAVDAFDPKQVPAFASVKCFFKDQETAIRLSLKIENDLGLHAPLNRDPFDPHYYIVQATHPTANKGEALRYFMQLKSYVGPVIAAGDDHNDLTLLQAATVKVVMANASPALLQLADVVAPPASQNGILVGLEKALKKISNYTQRPLVTVGGLIIASDGEILLVRSEKWSNLYSVPGGKVEWGETREKAFEREIWEETGLKIVNIRFAIVQDCIFSREFWQKRHFVMNDFIADLSPTYQKESVVLNSEACEYQWIAPEIAFSLPLHHECHILIEWYLNHKDQL
jgi:hydroxymethylpyrimidine pyrophosphatase-like HAD family hydrolase/ADP-ribose pyrophosphatase YjhB (NUDIX family)